jgi:hypothetical protein
MDEKTEDALVARLAERHGISSEGVRAVLTALRSGGGSMAQFSHPDFGGMSQWSSGMTMVGDMFNDGLKSKLDAIATELAAYVRANPNASSPVHSQADRAKDVSYRSRHPGGSSDWWPDGLGVPGSVGAQNDIRYAVFPESRRLVIDDHGTTKIYDTSDHRISGVGQAQGAGSTLTFTSQRGVVKVSELTEIR